MLPVAVARSSSDREAMRYVDDVMFSIMEQMSQNQRQRVRFAQFAKRQHRGEVCRL